jgi:DNA repair photolyase
MPPSPSYRQLSLFPKEIERSINQLRTLGTQADIRYVAIHAKQVLNGPEVTGMGFWSINPYVGCAFGCAYCYARYAHRYVMERHATADRLDDQLASDMERMPPWLAFERRIFVKQNAADILARTLRDGGERYLPLVQDHSILIGSATDPYQPAERTFRLTRRILEVLANYQGLRITIITKSPLITRDIDVLKRIMRYSTLRVHLSLITLDRDLARRIEPRAPTPESRIRALERLRKAGIDTGINCMPVLPGITDDPAALEALVKRVAEAGATHISACALRLDRTARLRYFPFLAQEFPELAERYQNSYSRGRYVGEKYRQGLSRYMKSLYHKYNVNPGY